MTDNITTSSYLHIKLWKEETHKHSFGCFITMWNEVRLKAISN